MYHGSWHGYDVRIVCHSAVGTGKYIEVVGSETTSLILVQIFYVLVLRKYLYYWHRHLKQCLGYVYRHGTCWL
jgi:hypothetical protein